VRYASLTGLFAVYKPRGVTSRDLLNVLVARLSSAPAPSSTSSLSAHANDPPGFQRSVPQKHRIKLGHGGTLDKAAEGLVVVATQGATKLLSRCLAGDKGYRVEAVLGVDTDTHDLDETSRIVRQSDEAAWRSVTRDQLEDYLDEHYAAVDGGVVSQVPPIFSALKSSGQRLSHLARSGQADAIDLAARARPVRVHRIHVVEWSPPLYALELTVGSGFYVRSLVRDIGAHFGCGSTMSRLQRTQQAGFDLGSEFIVDMSDVAQQRGFRPPSVPRVVQPLSAAAAVTTPAAAAATDSDAGAGAGAGSDDNATGAPIDQFAALNAVMASAGLLDTPCMPRPATLVPFSVEAVQRVLAVPLEQRRIKGYVPPEPAAAAVSDEE
jgi:tRNA pseudouridine55 synthase